MVCQCVQKNFQFASSRLVMAPALAGDGCQMAWSAGLAACDNILMANRLGIAVCTLCVALLCAQDWQTSNALPAVDLGGLTPAQKNTVLKLLRENECVCGCGM